MRPVSLAQLQEKIVRPGFEKHLKPLLMYRGNMTLGRAHRLWNLFVSAMEHEASASDLTQRLAMNPEHSQLCGPERRIEFMTVRSFAGRVLDNPKVAAEMPHLEEYIRDILPPWKRSGGLTRVSETTNRRRNMGAGGWRRFVAGAKSASRPGTNLRPRASEMVYPFLIHDGGKPEHDLLKRVNAAIPKHFSPDLRADMCQDLIVGILCGDFPEDNLALPAKEMTKRVLKMFPTKYGPLSLDAEIPGTDGFRLIDTLSNEDSIWARI